MHPLSWLLFAFLFPTIVLRIIMRGGNDGNYYTRSYSLSPSDNSCGSSCAQIRGDAFYGGDKRQPSTTRARTLAVRRVQADNTDVLALLQFKSSIDDDPHELLSGWNSSVSSPCNWNGVNCNSASRVVGLDLRGSNLTGTIAPQLGNIEYLRFLNLSVNNLTGIIPTELGQLHRLQYLDLKSNQLESQIPQELGQCQQLLWLDLSHNQLFGNIPTSLGSLINLYSLQLHHTINLTGVIPPQLGELKNLTDLNLGDNSLLGEIPPFIGKLKGLTKLSLFQNKLSGSIPSVLGQLENLQLLSLFSNSFQGGIPPELGNLTSLQHLYLFMCNLSGEIPPEIGRLSRLQVLALYMNRLSGRIPPELGQLQALTELNLFSNNLNGSIPPQIGQLRNLRNLYLFSNRLSGEIPPHVGELQSLQNLHLYYNNLQGQLPAELGRLKNLLYFIAFSNSLSGTLPARLGELKNLVLFSLGNNSFSGEIPTEFGMLENLQFLELNFNNLSGAIPDSLGRLIDLKYIRLSSNKLSGTLPSSLANCTKLQYLKLNNNSLRGEIPAEYGSLNQLLTLSLSNNNLTGKVPNSLAKCKGLEVLDLQQNHLSGELPDSWDQLMSLRVLSLAYNKFQGPLPSWIWNLSSLQLLDLSHNRLFGNIPNHFDKLEFMGKNGDTLWQDDIIITSQGITQTYVYVSSILTSLDLSVNNISGQIPSELGLLAGLFNLNISNNRLTGSIPGNLGNITALESLDLSNNQLSGQIPQELVNLTSLSFLNLSNNNLSGQIPQGNQFYSFTNASYLGNSYLLCGFPLSLPCSALNHNTSSIPKPTAKDSNRTHCRKCKLIALAVAIGIGMVCLGVIILKCFFYGYDKRKRSPMHSSESESLMFGNNGNLTEKDLFEATEGYSDSAIIGSGGFSVVYKAALRDGSIVAVKKLTRVNDDEALNSFLEECSIMGHMRHRNLVRMLGYCFTPRLKALILEYIPNGSLDKHLHENNVNHMSWETRLKVLKGIAQGLTYLHEDTGFGQILHCDLKPGNILLDGEFEAHIGDFGISRLNNQYQDGGSMPLFNVRGSYGYLAPEYAHTRRVSDRADVYSYGIIILEIITGRKPTSEIFHENTTLPGWVRSAFPDKVYQIIDPTLQIRGIRETEYAEMLLLLQVGLFCTQNIAECRPTMKEVVKILAEITVDQSKDCVKSTESILRIDQGEDQIRSWHFTMDMQVMSDSSLFSAASNPQ